MKVIVDRIEEGIAVCESYEDEEIINVDLTDIPFIIEEGDVLIFDGEYWQKTDKDSEMHERIKNKMEDLWN